VDLDQLFLKRDFSFSLILHSLSWQIRISLCCVSFLRKLREHFSIHCRLPILPRKLQELQELTCFLSARVHFIMTLAKLLILVIILKIKLATVFVTL